MLNSLTNAANFEDKQSEKVVLSFVCCEEKGKGNSFWVESDEMWKFKRGDCPEMKVQPQGLYTEL